MLGQLALSALVFSASTYASRSSSADTYISTEGPLARAGMLANIGPDGSKSSGASPGVVVASPSTTNPDYVYTWVRDSSLVFKTMIDQFTTGQDDSFGDLIDDFVSAEAALQQVANPSGNITTGGLGEPKFYVNETAFEGSWGRPQRDGPALRSTAMITFANYLLVNGNTSWVANTLWPIIQLDLDYVQNNWNQTTFDLWEEIQSSSFFTTAVQHRALRMGSALAVTINQTSVVSEYNTQADNLLCFLQASLSMLLSLPYSFTSQSYWNPSAGFITANTGGGRSGIDANTALASIHTFDPAAGCDANTFQPCSDKALSSLKIYVDSFRSLYAINAGIAQNGSVATGRYPEDVYMDGNPWYLTTNAVAEQLYDSLTVWNTTGSLNITNTSLAFFQDFIPSATTGSYDSSSSTYTTLISAVKDYADGFLAINAQYTPADGGLSEQYSKTNGTPVSAVDLTWSYASALTAFSARNSTKYTSWGAAGLAVPATCKANSGNTVAVTFTVQKNTTEGGSVYITGSVDALQDWNPSAALLMNDTAYPSWTRKYLF
ncbi:hypothetical protein HWV62_37342 [Athelia sp. TMB]|nr:hypothetical protein HWV62_37342 [Athelia sp. TMB]